MRPPQEGAKPANAQSYGVARGGRQMESAPTRYQGAPTLGRQFREAGAASASQCRRPSILALPRLRPDTPLGWSSLKHGASGSNANLFGDWRWADAKGGQLDSEGGVVGAILVGRAIELAHLDIRL